MTKEKFEIGFAHKLRSDEITTTQLVKYAGASGDYNRIHFDEPFARERGLPGVIAHGLLTMAIAGRCLTEMAGDAWLIGEYTARFLSPVQIGNIIDVTATVADVDANGGIKVDVVAEVGDVAVLKGAATLVAAG